MLGYMIVVIAMLFKAFVTYSKYVLIKMGRLQPPYRTSLAVIAKNIGLYLGTDIKGRVESFGATLDLADKQQNSAVLSEFSSKLRRELGALAVSVAVLMTTLAVAQGRIAPLLIGIVAALVIALWAIVKI